MPTAGTPLVIAAFVGVVFFAGLTIIGSQFATWAFVFVLFLNLPGIATQRYGISPIVAASAFLLPLLPFAHHLWIQREKVIVTPVWILMLVFLTIVLTSTFFFARDIEIALNWVVEFVLEGPVLYFLVVNVVRDLAALKRVIWVLMIAGSILGGLTVYQELTLSYDNKFGGLAQRHTLGDEKSGMTFPKWTGEDKHLVDDSLVWTRKVAIPARARGPMNDPNRYAQVMLMLLPLASFIFWQQRRSATLRILAGTAVLLIFSGMLLTYSRGAFLALTMLLGTLAALGHVRVRTVVSALLLALILAAVVSPGYFARIETILGAEALIDDQAASVQADGATRGRATEMLAALKVYVDNPILGVGPGQYASFYSQEYMADPEIAFKQIDRSRRAHCLYFELAAETGTLGIFVFIFIYVIVIGQLLKARKQWAPIRADLAGLATAFLLMIIAYLGTSIFLHLSFQRYFWLLLALASVASRLLNSDKYGSKTVMDDRRPASGLRSAPSAEQ